MRILLVDDHPVVRHGVRTLLETDADMQVVGETASPDEAFDLVLDLHPDVALIDLDLGNGARGVDLVSRIREVADTRSIIFSAFGSDADVLEAVRAGAVGYLLKDAPAQEIFTAIRAAHLGLSALTPRAALSLAQRGSRDDDLTEREIEVLQKLARGLSNRDLSRELFVSEATVKTHLHHIFRKFGVDNRASAIAYAADAGLIRLGRG